MDGDEVGDDTGVGRVGDGPSADRDIPAEVDARVGREGARDTWEGHVEPLCDVGANDSRFVVAAQAGGEHVHAGQRAVSIDDDRGDGEGRLTVGGSDGAQTGEVRVESAGIG